MSHNISHLGYTSADGQDGQFIRLTPHQLRELKDSVLNLVSAALIQKPGASVTDPTLVKISQIVSVIAYYDPEFVLKLAVYVRLDLNIRSTANYLLALASNIDECKPYVRKYFGSAIRLPSDWIDVAATYRVLPNKKLKGKAVPSCLRKAMVDKFPDFDLYQLGKYNNEKSVKRKLKKAKEEKERNPDHPKWSSPQKPLITIKQMVRDLHIKEPSFPVMCILGKKYPLNDREFRSSGLSGSFEAEKAGSRMKLPVPETWETLLSEKGNKASTWEELIEHKKLPFMAMLRNIRNLIYTGVHPKYHRWVQNKLSNQQTVANSRQFPFSFFSAYEVIPRDMEHFKELTSDTDSSGMRRKNRKPIVLAHMPQENIFRDYRNALDQAVKLATVYNCQPISGSVVTFCNVGSQSQYDAPGAKGMGSKVRNVAEIGYLLGLMCKYVCEDCDFRVYSSPSSLYPNTSHLPVELIEGTILDNMKLVAEVAEKLGDGDEFPYDYIEDMIRDKRRINTLLVLSHTVIDPGNQAESRLSNLLRKYRQEVNPDLLFVSVDLSGSGRATLGSDEAHPNDIMITGFSDQILRFIAERGDETQLQYVEHIDIAKKIGLDQVDMEAHISPWWKWLETLGQSEMNFVNITRGLPTREARLFISSTFLDMHGERDYLTRIVIPELKFRAKQRGVDLVEVDLRWGLTEEDSQHGSTLELCLDEVDRCRPFFIGILGDRYGWAPEDYTVPEHPRFDWVRNYPKERSVTELEIHHAVLSDPDMAVGSFFYFRDNSFVSQVPEEDLRNFVESDDKMEKMEDLKRRIRESGRPVMENYQCTYGGVQDDKAMVVDLKEFGDRVFKDLWSAICNEYPVLDPEENELLEERSYHQSFATNLANKFFGRKEELEQLDRFVHGYSENLMILVGEGGEGKSSLLSKFACDAADKDPHTFYLSHFIGASPVSTNIRDTLYRLCEELANAFGIDDKIPDDYKELCTALPDFIEQASFQGKLVIIIDGVDQLDPTSYRSHSMEWLPKKLTCKVIISSEPNSDCVDAIKRRNQTFKLLTFSPLKPKDRKEIVRSLLMRYHKKLDERPMNTQMRVLMRKRDSSNPLYLALACEELRLFGVYEEVSNRIKSLNPKLPGLFTEIIQRLEQDHGSELVKSALSLIACSRNGILEIEMQEILQVDDDRWLKFLRSLSSYLVVSEESGEITFFHRYFTEAVAKRYFTRMYQETVHVKLADYFYNSIDPERNGTWVRGGEDYRAVREIVYHMAQGKQWKNLVTVLTDIYFIELKITLDMPYGLINDYAIATSNDIDNYEGKDLVREYREFVKANREVLMHDPELTYQQAANLPEHSTIAQEAIGIWNASRETRSWIRWINKSTKSDPCKMKLSGFSDGVTSSCYSPYGDIFAVALRDCTIKIFESDTGNELCTLVGHSNWITQIQFSPDAGQIASVSWDNTVILWDVRSGALICEFTEHKRRISSCCYSNNGEYLATASWDCTVKVWETRGTNTRSARSILVGEKPINSISFSPDDREIIAGSWDGCVKFIDVSQYGTETITSSPGHSKSIQTIDYSPEGKHFVTGSLDKTVLLWDAQARKPITTLSKHSKPVSSVSYSKDGELLSSASIDGTVKVWDANLGSEITTFGVDSGYMYTCSFNPKNSAELATGSNECYINIWNSQVGTVKARLEGHTGMITSLEYSPCGKYIASASEDGRVIIWDSVTYEQIKTINYHRDAVRALAWSPVESDYRLATCSEDQKVLLWNILSSDSPYLELNHDGAVLCLSFDSKGKLIVSGSKDKSLRVWDSFNGNLIHTLKGHRDWVSGCHFRGNRIVSSSFDFNIRLWNARTGNEISEMQGHQANVNVVKFHPDGATFVSGSYDGDLKIWDSVSSTAITTLKGHSDRVNHTCYSNDGVYIASVSEDGTIKVWSPLASTELETLIGHSGPVRDSRFGPKNEIITSSDDRSARIWEISSPEQDEVVSSFGFMDEIKQAETVEKQGLSGHSSRINDCRINEDGTLLITASDDGSCRIWDLDSMKMVRIFTDPKERPYVGCDIKGDKFSMVTDTSYVTVYNVSRGDKLYQVNAFSKPATAIRFLGEENLIVGGWSSQLKNINFGYGSENSIYPAHEDWITAVASSEGKYVSAGWDKSCFVFDKNNNRVADLTGHRDTITGCSISGDGRLAATSSIDTTVKVWDLMTYSETATLYVGCKVNCVTFGTNETGRYIFTGGEDGFIRMWDHLGNEFNKFVCSAPVTSLHVRSIEGETVMVAGDQIGNLYYARIEK
eukprot:TRINITY_DN2127_c0_g1_i1.p1 TRINITY_DN2127_c0_g1~~TRINITY_DN2127_c0_g1_i1.p1  ORF type:complete len:2266 (+),score=515.97 TRINITY_DN2127_c0_g1_i1:47-6844(+)